ncbi:AbrB/MazE/SpoVT family DNA-binding domain-containing protein [Sandarakinorhabdus sp.]|uniref:AbrB/MazE/SpoVT family DNA-binding domain-containing protein n=1 Tax=Sandarakinorhabdus sp. TaxID=1916663 RepID=UPI003F722F88
MDAIATLSSKGQLVLPKSVRDRHGWKVGDRFQVIETAGALVLRAIPAATSGPSANMIFAEIDAIVAAAQPFETADADAMATAAEVLASLDAATRSR